MSAPPDAKEAHTMKTNYTQTLSRFTRQLRYEDIPRRSSSAPR